MEKLLAQRLEAENFRRKPTNQVIIMANQIYKCKYCGLKPPARKDVDPEKWIKRHEYSCSANPAMNRGA